MTFEEAFEKIAGQLQARRRRKTAWTVGIIGCVSTAIVVLYVAIFFDAVAKELEKGKPKHIAVGVPLFFCGCGILLFGGGGLILIRDQIKNTASLDERVLETLRNGPDYDRGTTLFYRECYEPALECFEKTIAELDEESRRILETLPRFFEEYRNMPHVIDGFPRPVPDFKNVKLWCYESCFDYRKQCFEKLGRFMEAEHEAKKLAAVQRIKDENEKLTEKYWEDFQNYYDD